MNHDSEEPINDALESHLRSHPLAGQPRSRDALMYQCGWAAASIETGKAMASARRWKRSFALSAAAVIALAGLPIAAPERSLPTMTTEKPEAPVDRFANISTSSHAAHEANSLFTLSQQLAMDVTPRFYSGRANTVDRPDQEQIPILRVSDVNKVLGDSHSL